jgi:hypothetical protein
MSAFLDPAELVTLTGYVKPSKQIEWLTRNRVPHYVNRFRRPVVRRDMESRETERPAYGEVR